MFNRKKIENARINFLEEYDTLSKQLYENMGQIDTRKDGTVYLRRIYEILHSEKTDLRTTAMKSNSMHEIKTLTERVTIYRMIWEHVYNYYYELNEDPNRFNLEKN